MSLCTEYGAAVLRWSMETFNTDVSHLLGDNLSPERCHDILQFLTKTEDPRCDYYYGHIVAVKPHWFADFQKWATEKGLNFPKPEKCFLSMTILK